MIKRIRFVLLTAVIFITVNIIGEAFYVRFDVTADKRYSLSHATQGVLDDVEKELMIRVYLKGDFPAEFLRLQIETKQFLEELQAENRSIKVQFINPKEQQERLIQSGMNPSQLTVEEAGKLSNVIIFPWAELDYGNKTALVSLLPNGIVQSQDQQMQSAIENLEYAFVSAINQLVSNSQKKIAVLTGNGQLTDIELFSLLSEVSQKHRLGKITLDSVKNNPTKTLIGLKNFDLVIVAKPSEAFTEREKYVIDQFIVHGGKSLWMLESVQANTDSLYNNGKMLAYPKDLNLNDLLFTYGIRINPFLVQDLYAARIPLSTGNIGNQPQFQNLPWFYHPLVSGNPYHPITKNILPVRLRFSNPIDTLENKIKKTPLLVSSVLTKKVGTPNIIDLQSISDEPKEKDYQSGYQLLGVLLEGSFDSNYKNRLKPFDLDDALESGIDNKMIVVSDGDLARNQILKGQPVDLSSDKWTNQDFGNKEFLLNAIDYLLDDVGLIELRNKSLKINLLDGKKALEERSFWQFLNVAVPLLLLLSFGLLYQYLRKRKYAR